MNDDDDDEDEDDVVFLFVFYLDLNVLAKLGAKELGVLQVVVGRVAEKYSIGLLRENLK